jgi:cytochrome c oxidase cbb3-type subunit III
MADKQEDLILDHNYDGIEEYDNPMPGWWVWGFILTIIFAFPYWAWVHLSEGHTILDELDTAMAAASAGQTELDASHDAMVGYLDNAAVLAAGKDTFGAVCAACHTADGGGLQGLGANLCDDNYKNVAVIEEIITIVRDGVPLTAMLPQGASLKPYQIVEVSAYAASLRGTTPANPQPPYGDLIPAWK